MKLEGERAVYHCMTKIVGAAFLLGDREWEVLRSQLWKVKAERVRLCLLTSYFDSKSNYNPTRVLLHCGTCSSGVVGASRSRQPQASVMPVLCFVGT